MYVVLAINYIYRMMKKLWVSFMVGNEIYFQKSDWIISINYDSRLTSEKVESDKIFKPAVVYLDHKWRNIEKKMAISELYTLQRKPQPSGNNTFQQYVANLFVDPHLTVRMAV